MQHAHVPARLFGACLEFCAQFACHRLDLSADRLDLSPELLTDCRKLLAHLNPEVPDLHVEDCVQRNVYDGPTLFPVF